MVIPESTPSLVVVPRSHFPGGPYAPMAVEEYAALQRALGETVVKTRDCLWRRVRPWFYRPLLPFQEIAERDPVRPWPARFAAAQYVVADGVPANSSMRFVLASPVREYCLDRLDYNRKRQVRLASKRFAIRPIADVGELKEKGHAVYVEFYERTRYAYKAERRRREEFEAWAKTIFAFPQLLVLGAYEDAELRAVSISHRVGDTVFYSTFFGATEAMKRHVSDLMLHNVRQIAAATEDVRQVFAGMFKGGKGLDDSYLLRGFKVVSKRSLLRANPLLLGLLRILGPRQYDQLFGTEPLDSAEARSQLDPRTPGRLSTP